MENNTISHRQLSAIAFMMVLSPLMHSQPRVWLEQTGGAAWLSPLIAGLAVALLFLLWRGFFPEGYAAALRRAWGKYLGGAVMLLYALWMVCHAGFVLRSGAERFIATIYPASRYPFLVVTMALACLPAALGGMRPLGRSAMIFRPVMLCVFALLLIFAVFDFNLTGILGVSSAQVLPALRSSWGMLSAATVPAVLCFWGDRTSEKPLRRAGLFWALSVAAVLEVSILIVLGTFGPALGGTFKYPFFDAVLNTTILDSVEHIEALAIALWVFSDFVLYAVLLATASRAAALCFGMSGESEEKRLLPLKNGRWLTLVCAAASLAAALTIAPLSQDMDFYSLHLIPALNALFVFILMPLTGLISHLRR
ncbi:MAG: spore germination protein [Oscillospiraceae bacterium]|nr:spore germination protein [Oscillospiraceae bacterium]